MLGKLTPVNSIRTIFLLAMAGLVLVLSLPLLYSGTRLLDNIIYQLGSEVLSDKLQHLVAPVNRRYETLQRVGLEDSQHHLEEIRETALAEFRRFSYMESGVVLVIGSGGDPVLGEIFQGPGDPDFLALLYELAPTTAGPEIVSHWAGGEKRLAAVLFYPPWQSHIAFSVEQKELFAPRDTFLRINLLVLAAALLGGILFTLLLRRYLIQPLVRLADYSDRVREGAAEALPAGPYVLELGRLRDDIGAMVASLRQRMQESEEQLATIRNRERELSAALVELRESEARYRSIFNAPSDAIFIHQADSGRIRDVNRGMLEMYGYSYDEALALTVADISANKPPYTAEEAGRYIQTAGTGEALRFEWLARRKNGELFWSEVALRRDSFKGEDYVIAVVRDVNERRLAAEDLANEKERLAITLESIGDGVITTDTHGRVTLLNPVAAQLTGWKPEEAAGKALPEVFNIINERSGQRCANPVDKVLAHGQVVALENHTLLIAKDGNRRPIADSGAPIRDRQGEIIGVVLVFRDMSDSQRLESELLKVKKLESVGVLAAGIAHDFNNLLTAIMGNVELARFLLKDNAEVGNLLEEARKAGRRAQGLTQQLLTFARGGAPVRKVDALDAVIRDSAAFVLRGSGVTCDYQITADLWLVEIDRDQISQVIQNIVLNARQAMADSGKISISCSNLREPAVGVGKGREGRFVAIAISDTGPGVASEALERVFDPYYTTKEEGSGLGLAICHSIISKHDGHIEVVSRPGKGTTFTIRLPASGGEAPTAAPAAVRPVAGRSARILMVDDEEMILEVASRAFQHLNHRMVKAQEGGQALEIYRQARETGEPFDLVIMDLTIPGGMGGREAAEKLLALDPAAKIVVASGYADNPVLANYREHGFVARLKKPFLLDELAAVIRQVLEAAGPDERA